MGISYGIGDAGAAAAGLDRAALAGQGDGCHHHDLALGGYTGVMFLAGITNISEDIGEACEIDGGDGWKRFIHITLPMIKPVVAFVTLTTLIGCSPDL